MILDGTSSTSSLTSSSSISTNYHHHHHHSRISSNHHQQSLYNQTKSIKIVLIGDVQVGKTSLVQRFIANQLPGIYIPTAFDKYQATYEVGGHHFTTEIWDTSGSPSYDAVRPLVYNDTHVFLLCFNLGDWYSLHNVLQKWYPEIRQNTQNNVPIILIGCQNDKRFVGDVDDDGDGQDEDNDDVHVGGVGGGGHENNDNLININNKHNDCNIYESSSTSPSSPSSSLFNDINNVNNGHLLNNHQHHHNNHLRLPSSTTTTKLPTSKLIDINDDDCKRKIVYTEEAMEISKQIDAITYVETSSYNPISIREAFEVAALAAHGKLLTFNCNNLRSLMLANGATAIRTVNNGQLIKFANNTATNAAIKSPTSPFYGLKHFISLHHNNKDSHHNRMIKNGSTGGSTTTISSPTSTTSNQSFISNVDCLLPTSAISQAKPPQSSTAMISKLKTSCSSTHLQRNRSLFKLRKCKSKQDLVNNRSKNSSNTNGFLSIMMMKTKRNSSSNNNNNNNNNIIINDDYDNNVVHHSHINQHHFNHNHHHNKSIMSGLSSSSSIDGGISSSSNNSSNSEMSKKSCIIM